MIPAQDLAEAALAHWGGAGAAPRLVKDRENVVFEVLLADGSRAALRLHRPGYQSRAAVESELCWAAALAQAGLPVARPLPTRTGGWTALAGDRVVSCTGWIDGAPIGAAEVPMAGDGAAQATLAHRVGALIARLHNATDALTLPPGFDRHRWDAAGLLGDDPLWGRFWDNPALSAPERAKILAARDAARVALEEFAAEGADFGLIHADVLRENVLEGPAGLSLIDFDDAGFGFRLYDLATALVQGLEEPGLPGYAAALLAGYRSERALPDAAAGRIWLFVMLRAFASAGWIVTRAAPGDPRQGFYAARALRMARAVQTGRPPWEIA